MSHQQITTLNTAVLDALGIDWKDQLIQSVRIDVNGPDIPVVTITRYLPSPLPGTHQFHWSPETIISQSHMVSAEPMGFDIDAACASAREAVSATIDRATRRAHDEIREAFAVAKLDAENRLATKVCTSVNRPDPNEFSAFLKSNQEHIDTMVSRLGGMATGLTLGLALCGLRRSA